MIRIRASISVLIAVTAALAVVLALTAGPALRSTASAPGTPVPCCY